MYGRILRGRSTPIPSLGTIGTYLKLFPPSNPAYVRFIGSRIHAYTDADLFKTIHVPPDEIQHCSPRFADKWKLVGRVVVGEWDQNPLRYDEAAFVECVDASFHQSLELHFLEGVQWEETPFVQQVISHVADGGTTWTCDDRDEIAEKCARVDCLYERIAEQGYMTQKQRQQADIRDLKPSRRSWIYRLLKDYTVVGKDEVTVNVARDGRLLMFSGKHRLSIAKILGLDSIPVLVLARHEEWQNVRDALNDGDDPSAVLSGNLDHPDLREFKN